MCRLVLASGSPRRRQFLEALGIPFEVQPSRADETLPGGRELQSGLQEVALRKAREVAGRIAKGAKILAADTAVVVGRRILGKPATRREAEEMLRLLRGRSHRVITAVALTGAHGERSLAVETAVRFRDLSEAQIAWYTGLEEPYDKAGGYAIQGQGAFLVASIRGSYTNVVGLPMAETVALLEEFGLVPWAVGFRDREVADD